jgi:hypothetical protein
MFPNEIVLWNGIHFMAHRDRKSVGLNDTLEKFGQKQSCIILKQHSVIFLNKEMKIKNNFHVGGLNLRIVLGTYRSV